MSKFSKGSEWRKWDLHIHTPLSIEQNYSKGKEDKFDEFIDSLEKLPADVTVVGITDYYFIDGYERVIKEKLKGRLPNLEKIFPILEFRIDTFGSAPKNKFSKVNLHILFDLDENRIADEIFDVKNRFLGKIDISKDGDERNLGEGPDAFRALAGTEKQGLAELFPKTEQVFKMLQKPMWRDKTFLLLGYTEWSFLDRGQQLMVTKKDLLKKANAILTAGEIDSQKKYWVDQFGLKGIPLLHSQDTHDFDKLGSQYECNTWIKADPTFQGLKQIIHEPVDRVFIGDRPPVLDRVASDKTRYINSLSIDHVDDYNGRMGKWFKGVSIVFNKELVAIIGNKGGGKSAIADILSLLGDTRQKFSFLNKDKFLANQLAENFSAQIIWESGRESPKKLLSGNADSDQVESVRYIPQNYFEKLTNEIEIKEFRSELEKIIFNHLPKEDRLGRSDFEELRTYKTQSINQNVTTSETAIQNINKQIVECEAQQHPEFLQKINGEIASKERDIVAQEKLLGEARKLVAPAQKQDSRVAATAKAIEKLRGQKDAAEKQLAIRQERIGKLRHAREELRQIKEGVLSMDRDITKFVEVNKSRMENQSLDINKIVQWKIDPSSIDEKLKEVTKAGKAITPFLVSVGDIESGDHPESAKKTSIPWEIYELDEKIADLKKQMTVGERQDQHNKHQVRNIEAQIKKLRGEKIDPAPDTLCFYQQKKSFVEKDLSTALKKARRDRIEISLEIYHKKKEILALYESFKEPVSTLIGKHEMLRDYNVNIKSSFNIKSNFVSDFLRFVKQNKKGSFYGLDEGEQKLREIISNRDLEQEDAIRAMLTEIIEHLECDKRDGHDNAPMNISDQVTNLEDFYSHVFSLRYLEPKYELKLGEKHLHELSPGERGVLLLVFYLMLDKENIPLILDQPEDNLDNQSVYQMLCQFIRHAKKNRQIFIVTHNPNLVIGADAEQVIHVSIDKEDAHKFSFHMGAIESPEINKKIVKILEGTMPAFDMRRLKYQNRDDS